MNIPNVGDVSHWVNIKVYTKRGGDLVDFLSWNEMTFEQRTKWDWYFKYRAALLQVKYPRYEVELRWGNEKTVGRAVRNNLENKLIAAKRKLTEWENKLARFEENWTSMFSVEEDPIWQHAHGKIEKQKIRIQKLKEECSNVMV